MTRKAKTKKKEIEIESQSEIDQTTMKITYKDYEDAKGKDILEDSRITISKCITEESKSDARFIILNSKTAYRELASLYDLPYGIKDWVKDNYISHPTKKVAEIVIEGTSNSLVSHRKFFDSMAKYFMSSPEYITKAKTIHLISFRKIKQYD